MPPSPQKVAAVCCRPVLNGDVMFLLVRSRGGNRWTFPKGTVEPGESPAATASREALEEAGVVGTVETSPLGTYRKVVPARRFLESGDDEEVLALLFLYSGVRSTGEPGRRPTWFLHQRAAMAFRSNPDDPIYREQLCSILDAAKARLYPAPAVSVERLPVQEDLV